MTATAEKDKTAKHALPSGATLHLGRPPFAAAARLRNALARAAGAKPITPEEMKFGMAELKQDPSAGGALLQRLLGVIASEDVEDAVFDCLEQATYEPKGSAQVRIKVTRDLLDHETFGDDAREDFYTICLKAGEAAVKPFLGALLSAYSAFLNKKETAPASK